MNPLKTDLSVYSRFAFEYEPVGVKFLFDKPEDIHCLNKVISFCEMPKEASQSGRAFYITKSNDNCYGKITLGMDELPAFAESGQVGVELGLFSEPRGNSRYYQAIPKLTKNTVNYVVFAPIAQITFEPDLLIIVARPKQLEIMLRAMTYSTGELYESRFTPVFGCAWLFTYPYCSGKVNYAPALLELGMRGKEVYPEDMTVISIPYQWIPIVTQSLEDMDWVLCADTDGRDKFVRREQAILEEMAKRYGQQ